MQQLRDLGIAQLLEFAEHENFAVEAIQFAKGLPQHELRGAGFSRGRFARTQCASEKCRADRRAAAVRAQNLERDRVEISTKRSLRLIPRSRADNRKEGFLRQLFRQS